MEYEFYYNWKYARKHNPSLMGFGRTGGYGKVRFDMRAAVDRDDRKTAEENFWTLLGQSKAELYEDTREDETPFKELFEQWFDYLLEDDNDERHFVKEVAVERPYDKSSMVYAWVGGTLFVILTLIIAALATRA